MKDGKEKKTIFGVLWAVQLAAEILAAYSVLRLNMLPLNWMAVVFFLALGVLAAMTALLLLLPEKQKEQKKAQTQEQPSAAAKNGMTVRVRHVVGIALAAAIIAACLIAASAANKLSHTVSAVTEGASTDITARIGVYVTEDDPAAELGDLAEYTFAVNESDGEVYLPQALEYIEEKTGTAVQTIAYSGITDMADALYNQEVQAVIVNEALVNVLSELDGYTDFADRTKEIDCITVTLGKSAAETDDSENAAESVSDAAITTTPFLIYLSGSDTRDAMLTTSRSDVNIIAVVNPNTKQILFVNTPRDYYISNPAGNGAKDKLTHCGIYGIDCSIQALSNLYQVSIDYYGQINFTGFSTLIDAVGGVTVYSDTAFTTSNDVEIQVGENQLDGAGTLSFVRERYALSGGDNDRGKNQMKVLKAVVEKLTTGTALTHYSEILDSLEGMFITDISSDEFSALVRMQLSDMADWDVFTYAVVGTGGSDTTYSMPGRQLYVMYPNEDAVARAAELMEMVVSGQTLTEADVE